MAHLFESPRWQAPPGEVQLADDFETRPVDWPIRQRNRTHRRWFAIKTQTVVLVAGVLPGVVGIHGIARNPDLALQLLNPQSLADEFESGGDSRHKRSLEGRLLNIQPPRADPFC